jgi:hypothetical protein
MDFHYQDLIGEPRNGYVLTNERMDILGEFAREVNPGSVLGIAGGGESLLLGFLPLGVPVTGVDISYYSMAATMLKAHMLKAYGPGIKTLIKRGQEFFRGAAYEFEDQLPENLKGLDPFRERRIVYDKPCPSGWDSLRFMEIWRTTADRDLEASRAHLEKLYLLNQDMAAVPGSADLVYASNTLDNPHASKTGLTVERVFSKVNPGGAVILVDPNGKKTRRPALRKVQTLDDPPWHYSLIVKN